MKLCVRCEEELARLEALTVLHETGLAGTDKPAQMPLLEAEGEILEPASER